MQEPQGLLISIILCIATGNSTASNVRTHIETHRLFKSRTRLISDIFYRPNNIIGKKTENVLDTQVSFKSEIEATNFKQNTSEF